MGTTQERKDLSGLLRILLSHPAIKSLCKRSISILETDTVENSVVLWTLEVPIHVLLTEAKQMAFSPQITQ